MLAPGFFTLASNVVTSSLQEITPEMPRWKQEYMTTSHKVILAETFSPTFVGLTFMVTYRRNGVGYSKNRSLISSLINELFIRLCKVKNSEIFTFKKFSERARSLELAVWIHFQLRSNFISCYRDSH